MKLRVGLPVLTRHITSLGGVGFFLSSLVDLLRDEVQFDLIVDRPVKSEDLPFEHLRDVPVICASKSLPYADSNKIDFFMGRKVPPEVTVNFYHAMSEAAATRVYDHIIVNSVEAVPGILHSNIHKLVNTVLYTHDPNYHEIVDSDEAFYEFGEIHRCVENIKRLTQLPKMIPTYHSSTCLPMPNQEFKYFETTPHAPEPGTAYFCGNYSDRKKPKDFVQFCKVNGKKALVLTNQKGSVRFAKDLAEAGVEYELKFNLFGEEKAKFIARGEVAFHPSLVECCPFAVMEALVYMPVYCNSKAIWTTRFPEGTLNFIGKDLKIGDNHAYNPNFARDFFNPVDCKKKWLSYLKDNHIINPISSSASRVVLKEYIDTNEGISVDDFWKKVVDRSGSVVSYLDSVTLYKLLSEYPLVQDVEGTYVNKKIVRSEGLESFFG